MVKRASVSVLALLAVVGLSSTLITACSPAKRVLVIGDSLTVGSVSAGLGEGTGWTWTVKAASGLGTNAGIELARAEDISGYDLVIVALGTNDYLDSSSVYGVRIDNMMEVLSVAKDVRWVNVDTSTGPLTPAAFGVNPAIAAAPGRHGELQLADWNSYTRTVPDWSSHRAGDDIHYRASGYAIRARWMESLLPA